MANQRNCPYQRSPELQEKQQALRGLLKKSLMNKHKRRLKKYRGRQSSTIGGTNGR